MESKLRKGDTKLSALVSQFLDMHFYNGVSQFERVNDAERQVKGIDTIFDLNGVHYTCDEKESGTRINSNLKTFSLELSFINRAKKRQTGWFIEDGLENNSYLFIWPDVADTEKPQSVDELHEVEIALVSKEKLKNYLAEHDMPIDKIASVNDYILNHPDIMEHYRKVDFRGNVQPAYGGRVKYTIKNFEFCHSEQLYESPVNLILPRETYRELADYNVVIKA